LREEILRRAISTDPEARVYTTASEDPSINNDPSIIWWDGQDDPENPYNWPNWRKVVNCGLISTLTFLVTMASSIFAPGVPSLMQEFGSTNNELSTFVVSVYVLGFAFGPMIIAPMSELYGRSLIYQICNFCFTAFLIACALAPSLENLIVFCFLAGTFGACPLTNGGGSIADMIAQEKRAVALAAFAMGPIFGPIIGPLAGGALSDDQGWRWTFGVVAIISGALSVALFFALDETYAPTILDRKVQRLQKKTHGLQLRSMLGTGLTSGGLLKLNLVRPVKLLILSPICTIFALFLAIVYGILYLLFSSIPFVFLQNYGFSARNVGLAYVGLGVGSITGMAWFGWDSNMEIKKNKDTKSGEASPEVRLKLLPFGAALMPAGLFVYGWTADYKTHWMGPIFGLAIFGLGKLHAYIPCVEISIVHFI
jgi:multidrug resistance protein